MHRSSLYRTNRTWVEDHDFGQNLPRSRPLLSNASNVVGDTNPQRAVPKPDANPDLPTARSLSGCKRSSAALVDTRKSPESLMIIDERTMELLRSQVLEDLETHRQRNRIHQARHKLRQKHKIESFEARIAQLQYEIRQLNMKRRIACASVVTSTSVWSVAAEYFRLFEDGYKAPVVRMEPSVSTSGPVLTPCEYHEQLEFLRATMSDDVVSDRGVGVAALLEDWMQRSLIFEDLHIQVVRLERCGDSAATAHTKTTVTLTSRTLRTTFPRLEERGHIYKKLLGRQLTILGSVRFQWDWEKHRVVGLQHYDDMLTPIFNLLGNLEDTAEVFNGAQLTPESKLVSA